MEVAGLAGLAAFLYSMAREMDDDDEFGGKMMDSLQTDHERALLIPLGGGDYFKVPIPFGAVNLAWVLGGNMVRAGDGTITWGEAAASTAKALTKSIIPTGVSDIDVGKDPAGFAMMTLMPGLAKPVAQVFANKNFKGGKLSYAEPDSETYMSESGRPATPEFYKDMATVVREATGADMAPEKYRALMEGYFIGPAALLLAPTADREAKGLAARGLGDETTNAVAKATGVSRLFKATQPIERITSVGYARVEEAREVLRHTAVAEPKEDGTDRETTDEKMERVRNAGATDEQMQLVEAYLEWKSRDASLRRRQKVMIAEEGLGAVEAERMESMRLFLEQANAQ
jgi:hypothetical protein